LSHAGRFLFSASRQQKTSANDADRLRKYLARFGLDWKSVQDETTVSWCRVTRSRRERECSFCRYSRWLNNHGKHRQECLCHKKQRRWLVLNRAQMVLILGCSVWKHLQMVLILGW